MLPRDLLRAWPFDFTERPGFLPPGGSSFGPPGGSWVGDGEATSNELPVRSHPLPASNGTTRLTTERRWLLHGNRSAAFLVLMGTARVAGLQFLQQMNPPIPIHVLDDRSVPRHRPKSCNRC